jgi:hypothetical protein
MREVYSATDDRITVKMIAGIEDLKFEFEFRL